MLNYTKKFKFQCSEYYKVFLTGLFYQTWLFFHNANTTVPVLYREINSLRVYFPAMLTSICIVYTQCNGIATLNPILMMHYELTNEIAAIVRSEKQFSQDLN